MPDTLLANENANPNPAASPTPASDPAAPAASPAPAADPAAPAADPSKPAEPVVPEKYEFKAPEGVTVDTELATEFEGIAKELKLPQDGAQKVYDVGVKLQQKFTSALEKQIADQSTAWVSAVKADKEIGGENLNQSLANAKLFVEKFGSPELATYLKQTPIGNHPELIRAFAKAGKHFAEDKTVTGGNPPPASSGGLSYPNSKHN